MADEEARRRRRLMDQAIGGASLFLVEVGVVLAVIIVGLLIAAITLALI